MQLPEAEPGRRLKLPRKLDELRPRVTGSQLKVQKVNLAAMAELPLIQHVAPAAPAIKPMTAAMRNDLYRRFPAEINEQSLKDFKEAMLTGIDSGDLENGGAAFEPASEALAKKYKGCLERGMYVCLKISEAVDADSPFKIADGASANEVMRQRIEQGMHPGHPGRQEGAFFAYCTTKATIDTTEMRVPMPLLYRVLHGLRPRHELGGGRGRTAREGPAKHSTAGAAAGAPGS